MSGIYTPKGAAREYSPLALNYIKGCDHGCVYCYVPIMMKKFNKDYVHSEVYIKEEKALLNELTSSMKKHRNSADQVFLSFLTDPYSHFNNETKLTRRVLYMLYQHRIPVSILTKGGNNIKQDFDIVRAFGSNIQVGASLTFVSDDLTRAWEKNSSSPAERFEMLKYMHDKGIKTWASLEPVIFPEETLAVIRTTAPYVDGYKLGKLNHFPNHEKKFDWNDFLKKAVDLFRQHNKVFYIKNDLFEYWTPDIHLEPHERDMDHMALKNDPDGWR